MAAGESYGLTGMVHKVCILRTINSTYSKQNKTKQNKTKQNKTKTKIQEKSEEAVTKCSGNTISICHIAFD
jgi:hypothetical protein